MRGAQCAARVVATSPRSVRPKCCPSSTYSCLHCLPFRSHTYTFDKTFRSTSGAMVLALTADACSALCAQWGSTALGGEDVEKEGKRELDEAVRVEYQALVATAPTFPAKGPHATLFRPLSPPPTHLFPSQGAVDRVRSASRCCVPTRYARRHSF
jgi:hypothetical protein